MTVHRASRKALESQAGGDASLHVEDDYAKDLEVEEIDAPLESSPAPAGTHIPVPPGGFQSFEDLVEASGMLKGYPPVPTGETGQPSYVVQPVQLLSLYPRAFLFPKFLDREKCKHVITLAEHRLGPSSLALKRGDSAENTRDVRTSQGTFMGSGEDPDGVLRYVEEKIAVLTGIPSGHGEPFNILRYELGQHYDSHYDSFAETDYGRQPSQRVATVLVYLSDVEEGGETSFLLEGKDGLERLATIDYKKCDTGIKYKPRAGDALLFWSYTPEHTQDKHSLHGGCPVINGTKWTMTKWIRDKCLGARDRCIS